LIGNSNSNRSDPDPFCCHSVVGRVYGKASALSYGIDPFSFHWNMI